MENNNEPLKPSYNEIKLFGGAIFVELPETFADVSTIRQVPDNQEVFLDKDGFTSIIFDITERVGPPGSGTAVDGAALTTHLEDITESENDTVRVWNSSDTKFSNLPEETPTLTLIATQTPSQQTSSSPDFTAIILTLIRLEAELTDILITINVPHVSGEYVEDVDMQAGKQGKLIENAIEFATKIWETFRIEDWSLFYEV
ncbi:hypothetical protein K3495_g3431 [Podosphaera aphanis]|nr:hypothetical protein K3495_g3431 [Podosphaera aphanis]